MQYRTQRTQAKNSIDFTPFPEPHIHYPVSSGEALKGLEQIQQSIKVADDKTIGIDTESNWEEHNPNSGHLLLLQLGWQSDQGLEALVIHRRLITGDVLEALWQLLTDSSITKCFQNMKFDRVIVQRDLAITIAPPYFDTLLAALVLDNRGKHGLGALTERYLRHSLDKSHQTSFAGFNLDTPINAGQVSYGAKDAVVLLPLRDEMLKSLAIRPKAKGLVELEHQVAEVMMEAEPPAADAKRVLRQLNLELTEQLQKLSKYWGSGQRQVSLIDDGSSTPTINLSNTKGLQSGLKKVGVDVESTSPDALLKVCHQHPSVVSLLRAKWLKSQIASIENAISEGKDPMAFIQLNKLGYMENKGRPLPLEDILCPDGDTQYWVISAPLIEWWALGAITRTDYGLAKSRQGLIEEHLSHLDDSVAEAVMKGAFMYKLGATRLALYVWEETGVALAEKDLDKIIKALKRTVGDTLDSWHQEKPTTSLRLLSGRTVFWDSKPSYRDWAEVSIKGTVSDWLKQSIIKLHQQGVNIASIYHQQIIIDVSTHCPNALKQAIYQSFQLPVQGFHAMLEVVIKPLANSI